MTPIYKQLRSMVAAKLAAGVDAGEFLRLALAERDKHKAERDALDERRFALTETIREFDTIIRILRAKGAHTETP